MKFLIFLVVLIPLMVSAKGEVKESSLTVKLRDGFPWPWSDQCEFDWTSAGGRWKVGGAQGSGYFEIEALETTSSDEYYVLIIQYNEKGRVIARGLGFYNDFRKGVMIPMQWYDESSGALGYWMHLSWVSDTNFDTNAEKKVRCSSTKNRYLAVKKTSFGTTQDDEIPVVLEKLPENVLEP